MTKIFRGFTIMFAAFLFTVSGMGVASADDFQEIADTGFLELKDNEAWKKTFKTDEGEFRIQFRKLFARQDDKKYHLIVWHGKERIAEGYFPKDNIYRFMLIRDFETDDIFISMKTAERVELWGFHPSYQELVKYVDSDDFYSPKGNPTIAVTDYGSLVMNFDYYTDGETIPLTQYEFDWDEDSEWFSYGKTIPEPEEYMTAPQPTTEDEMFVAGKE